MRIVTRFVQGDICDRALVDRLLREHRHRYHRAFRGREPCGQLDRRAGGLREDQCARHLHAAGGRPPVLAAGTGLGRASSAASTISPPTRSTARLKADDPAFSETTPYAPNSPYSASKAGSDHLVRAWFHTYGLPVTTSNCSNNYGPYQHAEKFIPTVIRSCLEGKPIPVYGDGTNIRDWLYVMDHCAGIDAVIRRGAPG